MFYKDGSQRSSRKVPKLALAGTDEHDAIALAILEEQDRAIAAKSGIPVAAIEKNSQVRLPLSQAAFVPTIQKR